MGYALIWVESLAATLALVALVTAAAAHWRFGPRAVPALVAILLVAFAAVVTAFTCYLHFTLDAHPISNPQSLALIAWTLSLAAGSAALLVNGLRRPGLEPGDPQAGTPAARAWSRPRLALAFGSLVALTAITLSNMDLAVKIQFTAVRAEAGAKLLAQIPPRLPDATNAALVYQEAFEYLAPPDHVPPAWRDKAPGAWKQYDRSAFDPKDKDLREFLRAQQRGLALMRKAAAMPGCSFEHDYSLGISMPIPELVRLPHAATLLAYDALAKAADGDARGALDDVAAIYGAAGHISDPLLIAVLVATGIDKTGTKVLEDALSLATPAPADLARLNPPEEAYYRRAVRRAMATEDVIFGMTTFASLAEGDQSVIDAASTMMNHFSVGILASPFYRVFFLEADLAAYRRVMHEMQQLAAKPYYEARPDWQALDASWKERRRGIVTALLAPATQKVVTAASEADAERLLARTALALTAFKAKTGAYPDKLDALVPDFLPRVPLDPFSGRSLRLKRDGAGLVIYSVGRDLTDDGGRPAAPGQDGGDLVFRLR
jgi:hypothetical protein